MAHLTDVQGEGTTYRDPSRTILESWGGRPLVAAGVASVEIDVARPGEMRAYALATDGSRVRIVPSGITDDGHLSFQADTTTGAIYYEIERTKR